MPDAAGRRGERLARGCGALAGGVCPRRYGARAASCPLAPRPASRRTHAAPKPEKRSVPLTESADQPCWRHAVAPAALPALGVAGSGSGRSARAVQVCVCFGEVDLFKDGFGIPSDNCDVHHECDVCLARPCQLHHGQQCTLEVTRVE